MTTTAKLVYVPPTFVDRLWNWLTPLLAKACSSSQGELALDEIRAQAVEGELSVWIARGDGDHLLAVALVRMEQWSGEIVCRVIAIAGMSMRQWRELQPEFERKMMAAGAKRIRFEGRIGWKRVLKDFRMERIVMEKRL